jgi:hypothetical protein
MIATAWAAGAFTVASAQDLDNRRARPLVIERDTVSIDTLSIVPGSFTLYRDGASIDPSFFTLDPYQAKLIWRGAPVAIR